MEQHTQYLYEYCDGKRIRNLGLMKIERQMDKSTIQLYGKEMDDVVGIMFRDADNRIYLGTWKEDMPFETYKKPALQETKQDIEPEEVDEYITPRNVTYEKIQRQDLSRLPRREWRLANNSFLLHGFYNYHHLLYIEENGEIWIGVPGIFHEKEKMAANAFGFTEFRRLTDVSIDLGEEEKNTYEDFGYWCRQISNSQV